MEHIFHIQIKDKIFGEDWLKSFVIEILDAMYEKTDVVEVVKELTHLNAHQRADLLWVCVLTCPPGRECRFQY